MDAQRSQWRRRRKAGALEAVHLLVVALCSIALLAAPVSASFFNFFGQKRFSYEGLIDTGSLGLDQMDGQVAAFGDVNGDSAVDLLTISSDMGKVDVYLWNHDSFSFQLSPSSHLTAPANRRIVNIVPADLTYSGNLDVLMLVEGSSSGEMELLLYKADQRGGFEMTPMEVPVASGAQPITLDASGDMRVDLLGYTASSKDKLSLWKNAYSSSNGSQLFQIEDAPLTYDRGVLAEPACQLAEPHSSAFIDLDGDCLADLFLVCHQSGTARLSYQIWTAEKSLEGNTTSYHLAKAGTLPSGTGALSFADMDRDGTIDVVFPSCEGSKCFLNIAYNKQIPLCSEKRSGWFGVGPGEDAKEGHADRCRDPQSNLCVADPQFSFDFTVSDENLQLARIALSDITPESQILMTDKLLSPSVQVPVALGDHNKDGYPDMAIITIPARGGWDETRLRLLESIPCNLKGAAQPGCPVDATKRSGRRTLRMMQQGTDAIDATKSARSVSFFDLAEDGSLDLLVQQQAPSGSKNSRKISFIQNNFFYDAFMLKVMTSNGACSTYCEVADADGRRSRYKPWGVNYNGASYKFTVLDTNGVRRAQQVGQLAQTAYRSLLTPYSYFGLGRTNNYVEALFVGTTKRRRENFVEIEGVIPNSQVMILPWEGEDGRGDASMWEKELYLSPGDWIPWVMVVLATIIVLLLGVVFVLRQNEKREDEKERKRAVHAINFDAL